MLPMYLYFCLTVASVFCVCTFPNSLQLVLSFLTILRLAERLRGVVFCTHRTKSNTLQTSAIFWQWQFALSCGCKSHLASARFPFRQLSQL